MTLPDALPGWRARLLTPEVLTFLGVGGAGYVLDVAAFNLFRSLPSLAALDPSVARLLTWRGAGAASRRREVALFIAFNLVGLALSVLALLVSHDLLGLTSATAASLRPWMCI